MRNSQDTYACIYVHRLAKYIITIALISKGVSDKQMASTKKYDFLKSLCCCWVDRFTCMHASYWYDT